MAMGEKIGDFSYQLTSVCIDDDGAGQQVHTSTWDGEASGYGTVLGTMTLYASASDEAGRMGNLSMGVDQVAQRLAPGVTAENISGVFERSISHPMDPCLAATV